MHKHIFLLFFILTMISCRMSSQQTEHPYTNHLIHENSPYLLQHAHNPVEWYPWGQEALEKAKKEEKMLLISIGYAACHWCHVMEHESFEDSTVAEIMNEHFVCIKIDREERPDIDDVYMTACQLASGRSCGWPLNAFALPDGRPVWAGTYFPREQWLKILNQFAGMWSDEKDKLNEYADQLTQGIRSQDQIVRGEPQMLKLEDAHDMAKGLIKRVDMRRGGREGAPKFPMPANYRYLLHYHLMTGDKEAMEAVEVTLKNMAEGGIYDQIGGGFARYSVDALWVLPHFEKMLYDNAQLLSLYSQAYQVTGKPLYHKIITETVSWLQREMTDVSGGFFSSLDADSEGEEGKYYVWTSQEIDQLLAPEEVDIYKDYFTIKDQGNWEEGKNILYRELDEQEIIKKYNLTKEALSAVIKSGNQKLFQAREKRIRPGLDDKILTSWNALMLTGLIDAYKATNEQKFADMAMKNAAFLKKFMMQDDYRLQRNYKDGQVKINGFLDDYAFTIEAFLALYQITFDEQWLYDAKKMADYTLQHFFDKEANLFNYTSDLDPPLVARKKEIGDNVIPGSNSSMGRNLNFLSHYFYEENYLAISDQLLFSMIKPILESGQTSFYSNWALLYLEKLHPTFEVAIVGEDYQQILREMQSRCLPNAIFLGGMNEGSLPLLKDKAIDNTTMVYVCQNRVCQLPVSEATMALEQIQYLE